MIYWLIASYSEDESVDVLEAKYSGEGYGPKFDGSFINDKNFQPEVTKIGTVPVDFITFKAGAIFCSEKAKFALDKKVDKEVQFIPYNLGLSEPFYLINVINIKDVLDLERSDIKYFPDGRIMDIEIYAVDQKSISDTYFFKIPQTVIREILCTENLKQLVEQEKLTGLKFVPKKTIGT